MHNLSPNPKSPKSWTTTVNYKSNSLNFHIQAENFLPNWGTGNERISLFLNLKRVFTLDFESGFREMKENEKKGRVKTFFGRIFGGWNKGKRNIKGNKKGNKNGNLGKEQCWYRDQAPLLPLMGTLSLLSHSSAQKDHKGITIHGFSYLFYLFLLFVSVKKSCISSVFVPIIISLLGFYSSYWNYFGIASNYSSLGWNWIFASLVFSQLFSFSQSISLQNRKLVLLFIVSIPILLYKFRSELIYQIMKIVLYGHRAWISSFFLTAQALFNTVFKAKGMNYGFGVLLSSGYFWGKEIINYFFPVINAHISNLIF